MSPHQFNICQEANGQFCDVITHFQPLMNLPSCITAVYTKNAHSFSARYSLQIKKTLDISIPSQLALNIWILTTQTSVITTAVTLICPGETTKSITIKMPIHILWLPPACNATLANFHIPPHYKDSSLEVNISLDMPNLNTINISALDFCIWQHLGKHQYKSQLQHLASIPSVPVDQLYKHMVSGMEHIMPFTSPEESTGDTDSIWTLVFPYRSLCNSYRITYTSRIRDLLLLFILVLTCQISMPIFTTRYHAIYNCGWWCRGSTHLQMWWQGPTTYKTSWESWPAYGANTYMDEELI